MVTKWQMYRYRLWLWATRPLICALGFHKESVTEWGTSPCSGMVHFYCKRCQKRIKSVPFDDLDPFLQGQISAMMQAGQFQEGGKREWL